MQSSTGRVVELDALRGLAALAVVAFHYTTHYQAQVGHAQPLGFGFPFGNYGVHLFFLISGFVIFMTLERTRSPLDFVVSRFSRLFPAYWAAMAVTAAVVYTVGLPGQRLPLRDLLLD
ncbi:MAG: acyltransferase family protein, partial [Pseudomonas sp.]|nr:acyltransferase family protein [Pseudomonas sp.]